MAKALTAWFRQFFAKRKGERSTARCILDDCLLVLHLLPRAKQPQPQEREPAVPVLPELCDVWASDWDECYQQEAGQQQLDDSRKQFLAEVFLYLGHINKQNWHFGALRMEVDTAAMPSDPTACPPELLLLRPVDDEPADGAQARHGVYTDMETWAHLVDPALPYCVCCRYITSREECWTWEHRGGTVPTLPLEDMEPFLLWHGEDEEKKRQELRKAAAAKKRKRGEARAGGARRRAPNRRHAARPRPRVAVPDRDGDEAEASDGSSSGAVGDEPAAAGVVASENDDEEHLLDDDYEEQESKNTDSSADEAEPESCAGIRKHRQ